MSLPQQIGLSYPNPPAPPAPTTIGSPSQLLMPTTTSSTLPSATTSCCENGRPIMTDPHTGQTICSCQYGSGLLSAYSRVPGLTDSVYSTTPYGTQGYVSALGTDPSAFYSPLNAHYDLKDNAESAWRSITQPAACYPYDPTGMASYPYGNTYGGMDLNGAARRKNATRETTNTLKAWLYEHRKNPYPTKGEKIMLAIITKMTLTQVSTWFANARRRLKKENKMTWSPRNRCGDGEDDDSEKIDDDDDDDDTKDKIDENSNDKDLTDSMNDDLKKEKLDMITREPFTKPDLLTLNTLSGVNEDPTSALQAFQKTIVDLKPPLMNDAKRLESPCSNSSDSGLSDVNSSLSLGHTNLDNHNDPLRPRIWSIAHVATSSSVTSTNSPTISDESLPLNFSRAGSSFTSTTSAVRPWMDSVFSLGNSMFAPNNNGYINVGSHNDKLSMTSTPGFNGLTSTTNSSSLLRPYPPSSSLFSPNRDLTRTADRIANPLG